MGQGSWTDMKQWPGEQPSKAPKEKVETQPGTLNPSISGRGRVLLIREFLKQEDSFTIRQIFPGQPPKDPNSEPACNTQTDCKSSSSSGRRGLKRTGDSLEDNPEGPTAKSKRCAEEQEKPETPKFSDLKEKDLSDCETAEIAELHLEPGKQLLLVLCHASALGTQLPRLQLLLQKVRVQDRRPPAALLGILVQPRPGEEAESRRRLEDLLRGVFASENPGIEVHTAVFCPSRPQRVLEVQRAASQAHVVLLVDRQTQTDGEGPEGGDWDCPPPPEVGKSLPDLTAPVLAPPTQYNLNGNESASFPPRCAGCDNLKVN